MHFHKMILALFVSHWPLLLAQQPCYWPDGSGIAPGQGHYVNCYASRDSACCLNGEVCLSNGLCYGSEIGSVRPIAPSFLPGTVTHTVPYAIQTLIPGNRRIEAHALSKTGVIRRHVQIKDATTVRTLSGFDLGSFL